MSDNMCEHGGLDGNCLRCKDATITRLKAENERLEKRLAAAEAKVARVEIEVDDIDEVQFAPVDGCDCNVCKLGRIQQILRGEP